MQTAAMAMREGGTLMLDASKVNIEQARREWARPDGIILLGDCDFDDYEPSPARYVEVTRLPVPWPFNLGPNGAFLVLLAMEAPFLIALLLKHLG